MKTKSISLTLAGLLAIQSGAMAQVDRTQGIGDQAIALAQIKLSALRQDLVSLDQTLVNVEAALNKKQFGSKIAAGTAILGAGIGIGLSVVASIGLRSKGGDGGGGLVGIVSLILSGVAASVSSASGVTGEALKTEIDTQEARSQIEQLEKKTKEIENADSEEKALVAHLRNSIQSAKEALSNYEDRKDELSRNEYASAVLQVAGTAMAIFGLTKQGQFLGQGKLTLLGGTLMTLGNFGQIYASISSSKKEILIMELNKTRSSIAVTLTALK